jgi:hypothetical protein
MMIAAERPNLRLRRFALAPGHGRPPSLPRSESPSATKRCRGPSRKEPQLGICVRAGCGSISFEAPWWAIGGEMVISRVERSTRRRPGARIGSPIGRFYYRLPEADRSNRKGDSERQFLLRRIHTPVLRTGALLNDVEARIIHFTLPSRLTTNLLIKAIDRKLAGVMSASGILTSNSASIVRTKLTMSSELRPAWRRSSSGPTGRVIERSESIR